MSITILAEDVVDLKSGGTDTYNHATFAVPPGTDCLIIDFLNRGYASGGNSVSSVTHNGDVVTIGHDNNSNGYNRVNGAICYRRNPDIGTFTITVVFAGNVRGIAMRMQALAGVKASGSPIGQIAEQRSAGGATDTVGLGLTPASSADSLVCASLAIATETTLTTWTGTGFTEQESGNYTALDDMTATFRRRLNAPAAVNSVSAKFGASDTNIGGLLYEILAEPVAVDVAGTIDFDLSVDGAVAGPPSATAADASYYNGALAFSEIWVLQPDVVGVDRRIHSVGPDGAPNQTLDQVAAGTYAANCYRWRVRLSTGILLVETGPGSQSTAAHVLAITYGPAGAAAYINGEPSMSSPGAVPAGSVDIGSGGLAIAGHAAASPAPYSGKVARLMRFAGQLAAEQVRLLSRSLLEPDALWGIGEEDDAQVSNESPIAIPTTVVPDGRAQLRFTPRVVDPNGVAPSIVSTTQPANGSVSIDGRSLILSLNAGWRGDDLFSFTVQDSGGKSSSAAVKIDQRRPAIKAVGDSITVAANGSISFDPRLNDVGAGVLGVVGVTTPANGTTEVLPDGRIVYTPTPGYTGADAFAYAIGDDWGVATALVAVTVSASSFVTASNDSVETTQGVAVAVDVLANDNATADNLPLVVRPGSVTAPSPSGSAALQSDGRIVYTPVSGFLGDVSFSYDAKPSAKAAPVSTASVLVRVVAAPTGYPKDAIAPDPSRILTVGYVGPGGAGNQYDSLEAAYGAVPAAGGCQIRVNDVAVAKAAGWTFDRVFGSDVVITSRNPLGATLNGRIFAHLGRKLWLYRLTTTCADSALNDQKGAIVCNSDFKITRCKIMSCNGVYLISNTDPNNESVGVFAASRNVHVGWNDFLGQSLSTSGVANASHIKCRMSNVGGIGASIEWDYFFIYRNLFNDTVGYSSGSPPTGTGLVFNFYIGDNKTFYPDFYCALNSVIEYNYAPPGNKRRFLYFKRGVKNIRFNHCGGCASEAFTQRHGWDSIWAGNRSDPPGAWTIIGGGRKPAPYNSGGTLVIGNVLAGSMQFLCGSGTSGARRQAADYGTAVGNQVGGKTIYGYRARTNSGDPTALVEEEGGKLDHFRLYEHTGVVANDGEAYFDAATCDIRPAYTGHGYTIPSAPTLSAAVVGTAA